jgi:membrane-bound metal-dependent hydrolase YbcI (DUF457 family)
MYSTAHLAVGLIIGKITGNYPMAIVGSLAIDIDHLIPHAQKGQLFNIRKIFNEAHSSSNANRSYLHSVFALLLIPLIVAIFSWPAALVLFLGYLGHFVLDLLDTSGFWPFFPFKKIELHGFLGYLSLWELVITVLLFGVYFWL